MTEPRGKAWNVLLWGTTIMAIVYVVYFVISHWRWEQP